MRLWHTLAFLLALCVLSASSASFAQSGITTDAIARDWNNLTQEQRAALAGQIAKQAGENTVNFNGVPVPPANVKAEDVEPWLVLIDKVGQGLVRLAKDLGVTANELLRTPVGLVTVGLVAYHVAGEDMLEILAGFLWLGFAIPIWLLTFYKWVIPVVDHKVVNTTSWGKAVQVHVPVRRRVTFDRDCGPEVYSVLSLAAIALAFIIFIA